MAPHLKVIARLLLLLMLLALAVTPAARAQVYPFFPPPGMTYNGTQWGPLGSMPPVPNATVIGNVSGSSASPTALDALLLQVMLNGNTGVIAVSNTNIASLSGLPTIDGVGIAAGQRVLLAGQTTASQNGIYQVQAGAWNRDPGFPAGDTILANCVFLVTVTSGTSFSNTVWALSPSSSIVIGTNPVVFTQVAGVATPSRSGTVKVSTTGGTNVPVFSGTLPGTTFPECASFSGTGGSNYIIEDVGDVNTIRGPCATENNSTGHLNLANGGFHPTASTGTLDTNSSDHWGIVTGIAAQTTETITFASAFGGNGPACMASASVSLTTPPFVSAVSTTAVTFTFSSLTGRLEYLCFGLN